MLLWCMTCWYDPIAVVTVYVPCSDTTNIYSTRNKNHNLFKAFFSLCVCVKCPCVCGPFPSSIFPTWHWWDELGIYTWQNHTFVVYLPVIHTKLFSMIIDISHSHLTFHYMIFHIIIPKDQVTSRRLIWSIFTDGLWNNGVPYIWLMCAWTCVIQRLWQIYKYVWVIIKITL